MFLHERRDLVGMQQMPMHRSFGRHRMFLRERRDLAGMQQMPRYRLFEKHGLHLRRLGLLRGMLWRHQLRQKGRWVGWME